MSLKRNKALDKLYEVSSRTDHPGLPVVALSNEIVGAGRLNSIASYFNYLVRLGMCIIVMIQVFGNQ
jgi:hypothetical protein